MKISKENMERLIKDDDGLKVTFEKKDGSMREMNCSLDFESYYKRHETEEKEAGEERKPHWSANVPTTLLVIDKKIDEFRVVNLLKIVSIGG